ncbi:MAG TPA: ABC transporter permease [Streptosporangiaceae bacterium]|jgi:NitT/TauT family transport system permease protein
MTASTTADEFEAPRLAGSSVMTDDDRPARRELHGVSLAAARLLAIAALLGIWQLCAGRLISSFWISSPSLVAVRLWDWMIDGTLWPQLGTTLIEACYGFLIGAGAGVLLGLLLGQMRRLTLVLEPIIFALYSLPRIALAPLFLLWFGIGIESKVVLSATSVFFLAFYNTFSGVRDVDHDLLNAVRVMGGSRRDEMTRVVLPGAMYWVFTGLKVSVPYAIIGAVVGEMVASNRGLGYLMQNSSGQFDTTGVFVALVVLAAVSIVINELLSIAERRVIRWKPNRDA